MLFRGTYASQACIITKDEVMSNLAGCSTILLFQLLAPVTGLLAHQLIFIHGEWHIQAPLIIKIHVLVASCIFFMCLVLVDLVVRRALGLTLSLSMLYLIGVYFSMSCYRLGFHRLSAYPGPIALKLSKLWHVAMTLDSKNYRYLESLQVRYGDFVRTGPSELTIFHPDVFMAIDGPQSDCVKAEFYDLLLPSTLSLVTSRIKKMHAMRRRQWSKGFSPAALGEYNTVLRSLSVLLERCIDQDITTNKTSDMSSLFSWFGFDAMGQIVFQKSFSMLQSREWHHVIRRLQRGLSVIGILGHVPWLTHIAFNMFPRVWLLDDYFFIREKCNELMAERVRLARASSEKNVDVSSCLVQEYEAKINKDEAWAWLSGDALLALVAGSEPITFTLIGLFNELAHHPKHAYLIRQELEGVDITDERQLARLPHLNGVIQETLRLYPALPTGGNRKTSSLGLQVGGRHIPPHTTIVAPRYCIGRRQDCFERPLDFIPERWYSRPDLRKGDSGFAPFGLGSRSCIGQALGMDAVRLVTAKLVSKYNFSFAESEDETRVKDQLTETFTSKLGQLFLKVEKL